MFGSAHSSSRRTSFSRFVSLGGGLFCTFGWLTPAMAGEDIAQELEVAGRAMARLETQANVFTNSAQEQVALDLDASGASLLVWQSRRQEEGTYGVFARRLAPDGTPIGGELHVNQTQASMQWMPDCHWGEDGSAWFVWSSHAQDGGRSAIVARRFSRTGADPELRPTVDEILVDSGQAGEGSHPVIAALPEGRAVVVWTAIEGEASRVLARLLNADGTPSGAVWPVSEADSARGRRDSLPCVAVDADDRITVAWARADAAGRPSGIYVRRFDAQANALGKSLRVDAAGSAHAIEPALALGPQGDATLAWLESSADGYEIRMRSVEWGAEQPLHNAVVPVQVDRPGYSSGLALDVDGLGRTLVSWSRHGDGLQNQAGLFAQLYDENGNVMGESFRVTARSEGEQKIAAPTGTQRTFLLDDGRMAFAWHGDAGLGDSSGAHLTLLVPEEVELPRAQTRTAQADEVCEGEGPADEAPARPHDPPTQDSSARLAPETDLNAPLGLQGNLDFLAVTNTGWTPPDPHMAVSADHIVVMTNGEIAFFDKLGNNLFRDEIENSFGFWGAQGATNFVFDPEVIWDPHTDRFMAMACERSSESGSPGYYLLAISDDSNPVGTWHKYRIDATPHAGDNDIDSPNLAVDENVIYLSADFFGPTKLNILMIDKSTVLNGGSPVFTSANITGDQSQGFPVTYDSGAPAQYMIGFNFSTSSSVLMYAIQNPLSVPTITTVSVTVPSYSHPEDPPQMGTSTRPETFEARFWSAVYRNGRLWATHHVNGSRVRQRWYEFDMGNWPNSGTPTLVQSGEIDLGGDNRTFFGSIWADDNGNAGMVYARSSPTRFISMERTFRTASDPPGTMRPPVEVIGSNAGYNVSRWGDYSAIVDDPTDASFWGHHEYHISGSWRTRVARWGFCDGGVVNYCQTSANSVGSGAIIGNSGSTSVAANDFGIFSSGNPPNQFGIFYMGLNQIDIPFGNGRQCTSGQVTRFPLVQVDAFGIATYSVDNTVPPALGKIVANSTWNWQFWYRDPMGGGANFNTSDGLNVQYCP